MGPLDIISLLNEIAETIPLKLPMGDGAPQLDLSLADGNHFPIASAWAAADVYSLPNAKKIRAKKRHFIPRHMLLSRLQIVQGTLSL
jgi:hypothetical protein